jgi:hypothetical protein
MARKGSGIGFVVLILALAIVLLLVAKNWRSVAPQAIQVTDPGLAATVDDRGQTEAGEAVRSGQLPDMNEMRQQTDAHAQQVQEALEATE